MIKNGKKKNKKENPESKILYVSLKNHCKVFHKDFFRNRMIKKATNIPDK